MTNNELKELERRGDAIIKKMEENVEDDARFGKLLRELAGIFPGSDAEFLAEMPRDMREDLKRYFPNLKKHTLPY